jgi:N-acetylglucosamine-6-phosphate deacetylase
VRKAIVNCRLILPDGVRRGGVLVDGGSIDAVLSESQAPPTDAEVIDTRGRYLAPGFIDVHVHGGGGFDLMTDDPEQVRGYARWIASRGVTSFLVSTSGRDHDSIVRRLVSLGPVMASGVDGLTAGSARVVGFHLEGPYINPARKGAFPPSWLRPADAAEYRELARASGTNVVQVALAPELTGADELIEAVIESGAVAAMGHTDATYEQAIRAVARGVSHVTHCFNAMRPFEHRDPGVVAAVMLSDDVSAELIGDGAHVDYAAARLLIRAKGDDKVVLITDGMPLAGTPDGEGEWERQPIRVEGGKAVRAVDGTIIGGVITLDQAVRNAVEHMGVPLHRAAAMASTNAARAMRIGDRYGAIAAGLAADFALLDDDLRVVETWVAGERVWRAES